MQGTWALQAQYSISIGYDIHYVLAITLLRQGPNGRVEEAKRLRGEA